MYNQKVLEIFKNPSNVGGLQGSNGSAKLEGDNGAEIVKLYILADENEVITNARFKTMGNVMTIVASSVVTELIIGKSVKNAQNITRQDILEVLGDVETKDYKYIDLVLEDLALTCEDFFKRKAKEEEKARLEAEKLALLEKDKK